MHRQDDWLLQASLRHFEMQADALLRDGEGLVHSFTKEMKGLPQGNRLCLSRQ
jgi:hypothetical protein